MAQRDCGDQASSVDEEYDITNEIKNIVIHLLSPTTDSPVATSKESFLKTQTDSGKLTSSENPKSTTAILPELSAAPTSAIWDALRFPTFSGRYLTIVVQNNPITVLKRFVKPGTAFQHRTKLSYTRHLVRKLAGVMNLHNVLLLITPPQQVDPKEACQKIHCLAIRSRKHLSVTSVTQAEVQLLTYYQARGQYTLMICSHHIALEDMCIDSAIKDLLFNTIRTTQSRDRYTMYKGKLIQIQLLRGAKVNKTTQTSFHKGRRVLRETIGDGTPKRLMKPVVLPRPSTSRKTQKNSSVEPIPKCTMEKPKTETLTKRQIMTNLKAEWSSQSAKRNKQKEVNTPGSSIRGEKKQKLEEVVNQKTEIESNIQQTHQLPTIAKKNIPVNNSNRSNVTELPSLSGCASQKTKFEEVKKKQLAPSKLPRLLRQPNLVKPKEPLAVDSPRPQAAVTNASGVGKMKSAPVQVKKQQAKMNTEKKVPQACRSPTKQTKKIEFADSGDAKKKPILKQLGKSTAKIGSKMSRVSFRLPSITRLSKKQSSNKKPSVIKLPTVGGYGKNKFRLLERKNTLMNIVGQVPPKKTKCVEPPKTRKAVNTKSEKPVKAVEVERSLKDKTKLAFESKFPRTMKIYKNFKKSCGQGGNETDEENFQEPKAKVPVTFESRFPRTMRLYEMSKEPKYSKCKKPKEPQIVNYTFGCASKKSPEPKLPKLEALAKQPNIVGENPPTIPLNEASCGDLKKDLKTKSIKTEKEKAHTNEEPKQMQTTGVYEKYWDLKIRLKGHDNLEVPNTFQVPKELNAKSLIHIKKQSNVKENFKRSLSDGHFKNVGPDFTTGLSRPYWVPKCNIPQKEQKKQKQKQKQISATIRKSCAKAEKQNQTDEAMLFIPASIKKRKVARGSPKLRVEVWRSQQQKLTYMEEEKSKIIQARVLKKASDEPNFIYMLKQKDHMESKATQIYDTPNPLVFQIEVSIDEDLKADENGVRLLWKPQKLRESTGNIPELPYTVHSHAINLPKSIMQVSSHSFVRLMNPLKMPQWFSPEATTFLTRRLCNLPTKSAFQQFGGLVNKINTEPIPKLQHLYIFFQLAVNLEFHIFVRQEYSFMSKLDTKEKRLRLDCYVFEDAKDHICTISLLTTQMFDIIRYFPELKPRLKVVNHALEIPYLTSTLTKCVEGFFEMIHARCMFDFLAEYTHEQRKPRPALLALINSEFNLDKHTKPQQCDYQTLRGEKRGDSPRN